MTNFYPLMNKMSNLLMLKKYMKKRHIRLGIGLDNKLNFEKHISTLCRKASKQLNVISKIQHYVHKKEKEIIINSFVYSNVLYFLLT